MRSPCGPDGQSVSARGNALQRVLTLGNGGGNHRTGCIEALGSKRHELFTLPMGTSVNRRYVARIWLKGTDEGGRHTPIALRAGMHYTCPVFFTNVPQLKGSGFELPILF